ncbi:MAG TPA: class I SAM-dependent methyltransferase [Tepidisphaeraceae bacterium]|nr:class I SAM-dependent methyltransferase [Tepidisphaeraceae bacterium]
MVQKVVKSMTSTAPPFATTPANQYAAALVAPSRNIDRARRLSVWSAYQLGLLAKTGGDRNLVGWIARHLHQPSKLAWLLSPIDFLRYRELGFALEAIAKLPRPPQRVLDLSSPKLLPLTLAHALPSASVLSTDLLAHEVNWSRGKAVALGLSNLQARQEDARCLSFDSDCFDLVTSISVFEHIAPEADGDAPAIAELARVLAPGGTAVITVPCSRTYHADYIKADVYERQAGSEPLFFQRFYTPQMLHERFVRSSGLTLKRLDYIEERCFSSDPKQRVAHWINCSTLQNRVFGPMYPMLSKVFLSEPRPLARCRKPYVACLQLVKPLKPLAESLN